jgi:hypothetical protein
MFAKYCHVFLPRTAYQHASLLRGTECAALCLVLLPIRSRTLNSVTKRSGRKRRIDRKDHGLLSIIIDALSARNDRQLKHPRVLAFR